MQGSDAGLQRIGLRFRPDHGAPSCSSAQVFICATSASDACATDQLRDLLLTPVKLFPRFCQIPHREPRRLMLTPELLDTWFHAVTAQAAQAAHP